MDLTRPRLFSFCQCGGDAGSSTFCGVVKRGVPIEPRAPQMVSHDQIISPPRPSPPSQIWSTCVATASSHSSVLILKSEVDSCEMRGGGGAHRSEIGFCSTSHHLRQHRGLQTHLVVHGHSHDRQMSCAGQGRNPVGGSKPPMIRGRGSNNGQS